MRDILDQDFQEWWKHPVTEALMEVLQDEYDVLAHNLACGGMAGDPTERIYMGYVHAIRNMMDKENLRESIVVDSENEED